MPGVSEDLVQRKPDRVLGLGQPRQGREGRVGPFDPIAAHEREAVRRRAEQRAQRRIGRGFVGGALQARASPGRLGDGIQAVVRRVPAG